MKFFAAAENSRLEIRLFFFLILEVIKKFVKSIIFEE